MELRCLRKLISLVIALSIIVSLAMAVITVGNAYTPVSPETLSGLWAQGEISAYDFYGKAIKPGYSESYVLQTFGNPIRKIQSEYGFTWYVYNYRNEAYIQIGIKNSKVVALYSYSKHFAYYRYSQSLQAVDQTITIGTSKSTVRSYFGTPLTRILKGGTYYNLSGTNQKDFFLKDNTYIVVFYDVHNKNTVTAIQVVDKSTEDASSTSVVNSSTVCVGTHYTIITTRAIRKYSRKLYYFARAKEAKGFVVDVVTEDIWGGGTGNTAADNIRAWLQNNYLLQNTQYVLLVGNPDPVNGDVPMKNTQPMLITTDPNIGAYYNVPTDLYYADLTGNWDSDNDGLYAEYGTGIDLNFKVVVGRIPYYGNITDLDSILQKTIDYGNAPSNSISWRKNVLLPMKPEGYTGFTIQTHPLGEAIKNDILKPKGWSWYRIYEENFGLTEPPEKTPITEANVLNAWQNNDYGLVVWASHGTAVSGVISSKTVNSYLNKSNPTFTFQASCGTALPKEPNNLAYTILKKCGIGTVGATRRAVETDFSPSLGLGTAMDLAYRYSKGLVQYKMTAGQALQSAKTDYRTNSQICRLNWLIFNLYGDPSIGLYSSAGVPEYNASVSDFTWNPSKIYLGNQVSFTATIKNQSCFSFPAGSTAKVIFYYSDSIITESDIKTISSPVKPNETFTLVSKPTNNLRWGYGTGSVKATVVITTPDGVVISYKSSLVKQVTVY